MVEVLKIASDVTQKHSDLLVLAALSDALRRSMAMIEFTPRA